MGETVRNPAMSAPTQLWIAYNGYLGYGPVHAIVEAPDEETARTLASDAFRNYAELEDKDQFSIVQEIEPLTLPYVSD
jgi:hypothetical protein